MQAVLDRDEQGQLLRKAGIMAVAVARGLLLPMTEYAWSYRTLNSRQYDALDPASRLRPLERDARQGRVSALTG